MDYIPQHVINDIHEYKKNGHTIEEMMELLREHYEHLSEKTVRRVLDGKSKTSDI